MAMTKGSASALAALLMCALVTMPSCKATNTAETLLGVWPAPVKALCTGSTPRKLLSSFRITTTQDDMSPVVSRYHSIISDIVNRAKAWAPLDDKNAIRGIVVDVSQPKVPNREPSAESYSLTIHDTTVVVHAPSLAGASYALETLTQILGQAKGTIPCTDLEVQDSPALAHRGIILDVASRYMDLATIRQLIDAMLALKLNVLSLHFSDLGAFRAATNSSELTDDLNGLYPGHVLRHLTNYAKERGVRLVPHLELPTHASGFQPAEDVFFCTSDDPVLTDTVLNNDPSTKLYLRQVLADVVGQFDAPYTFVGGAGIAAKNGNCSRADVQTVFRAALKGAQFPGKDVAVWSEAVAAMKDLDNDTIVFATPGATLDAPNPTVLSGYRTVNASIPSLPLAGEGLSQSTYRDYAAKGAQVSGASAALFTNAMCKTDPCGSNSTITPPAHFLAPRTQDRPARNATLSALFPRVAYMAGAAWNYQNITSDDLNSRIAAVNSLMAARGMQVCPSKCDCTLEKFCGKRFEHYNEPIKMFEGGFIIGTIIAAVMGAFIIFLQVKRIVAPPSRH